MERSPAVTGVPMTSTTAFAPDHCSSARTIEVSVRGRWVKVPAVDIDGQTFVIRGRRIRIASLHDEDWVVATVTNPAECVRVLKEGKTGVKADILSFSQKEQDIAPRFNYPMEMRSLAVANVSSVNGWWQRVSHGTRCNIKQSKQRGVEVRLREFDDDLIRSIMSVQNESSIRQGRRFYHFGKSFDEVKRDHGSYLDSCDFICAYRGDEFLGFLKLVYRGDVASIMQINSRLEYQSLRPTNALLAKAVEICVSKGVRYLVYGEFNHWNKRANSLRDFKRRNGFEEMLVPTYYVPLTLWGWFCVKTRLYRGPLGILPSGVITVVLELRRRWYSLRMRNGRTGRVTNDSAGKQSQDSFAGGGAQ